MRIVHITNHFLPSSGGVEWSVLRTAEAQVRRGDDVTVITETPAGEWDDRSTGIRIIRFQVPVLRPFTRLLYWQWMWKHRNLLREADILHFHDYTVFIHWFLPLRPFIRSPRYAVTFHGFEYWPVRLRHRIFRSITARLCHVRFAVGSYVRQLYTHPIDAVYIGAPVRTLQTMNRSAECVFAYAGRLAEDTQILQLAELLSKAARETQTALRLELAGEGPLDEALLALQHESCTITLHGLLQDTRPLYEHARFIIATGFLGILDAFQTGIPVLIPAFNEIKRSYVASIDNIDDKATVLRSEADGADLLSDLLAPSSSFVQEKKAEHASAFVSECTWNDIAAMMETWYRNPLHDAEASNSRQRLDG